MNLFNTWNSLFVVFLLIQSTLSLIPSLDSVETIQNSPNDVGSCPHCTNSIEVSCWSFAFEFHCLLFNDRHTHVFVVWMDMKRIWNEISIVWRGAFDWVAWLITELFHWKHVKHVISFFQSQIGMLRESGHTLSVSDKTCLHLILHFTCTDNDKTISASNVGTLKPSILTMNNEKN